MLERQQANEGLACFERRGEQVGERRIVGRRGDAQPELELGERRRPDRRRRDEGPAHVRPRSSAA
jgi:hypothetical protein